MLALPCNHMVTTAEIPLAIKGEIMVLSISEILARVRLLATRGRHTSQIHLAFLGTWVKGSESTPELEQSTAWQNGTLKRWGIQQKQTSTATTNTSTKKTNNKWYRKICTESFTFGTEWPFHACIHSTTSSDRKGQHTDRPLDLGTRTHSRTAFLYRKWRFLRTET